jgi:hypothetical protein
MFDAGELEKGFHQRMLDLYARTGEETRARGQPYWPRRYLE